MVEIRFWVYLVATFSQGCVHIIIVKKFCNITKNTFHLSRYTDDFADQSLHCFCNSTCHYNRREHSKGYYLYELHTRIHYFMQIGITSVVN